MEAGKRPDTAPPVRAAVAVMKPYVPGKSLESVQREFGIAGPVKMNQNENPLGPSPLAVGAITSMLAEIHIYPDGLSPALRERLARLWNVPPDWFLIGNGSDEVFRLLAETYLNEGDRVVVPVPSFAGYPLVADLMGADVIRVPLVDHTMDLPAMARIAAERDARMVFLCRPNNPTGGVFPEQTLRDAMKRVPPDTLVVLDEAYVEFDETLFDSRSLVLDYPNLIVARTFSKIFGLAGIRLGYGVMRPELLAPLLRVRDPFSVNLPAVAAGVAALDDAAHIERTLRLVRDGRRRLYALFERLGVPYTPTQANFILFSTVHLASEVYESMLCQGVLLRPLGSFGLPHSLRVTIGTEEQNDAFAAALESSLGAWPDARRKRPAGG